MSKDPRMSSTHLARQPLIRECAQHLRRVQAEEPVCIRWYFSLTLWFACKTDRFAFLVLYCACNRWTTNHSDNRQFARLTVLCTQMIVAGNEWIIRLSNVNRLSRKQLNLLTNDSVTLRLSDSQSVYSMKRIFHNILWKLPNRWMFFFLVYIKGMCSHIVTPVCYGIFGIHFYFISVFFCVCSQRCGIHMHTNTHARNISGCVSTAPPEVD